MATLYQRSGSDKWWIRYSKDGKQIRKSTGTSDRRKAELQLREVELLLGQHKESGTVSQKLAEAIQSEALHPAGLLAVFEDRLKRVSLGTQGINRAKMNRFLGWLGEHYPDVSMVSDVTRSMVREFMSEVAEFQKPRTHNGYLRYIRTVFNTAVKDGYILTNPTAGIDFVPEQPSPRRAYTEAELKKLFSVLTGNTRLLATIGLYAGAMRLSDIINLKWRDIDMGTGVIRWRMRKRRGKHMAIAIHPQLESELKKHFENQSPDEPVFPWFNGGKYRASEAFRKALVAAKLIKDTRPDNNRRYKRRRRERETCEKEGRDYVSDVGCTRPKNELDFHSLRYNFVSILKNQGCPEAIARSIMGHASAEVNAIYTQIDPESERKWVTSLPAVFADQTQG